MDTNYRVDYRVGWSKTSVAITLAVFAVVIGIIVGLLIEGTPIVSVEFLILGLVLIIGCWDQPGSQSTVFPAVKGIIRPF